MEDKNHIVEKDNDLWHMSNQQVFGPFICLHCHVSFTRKDNYQRHLRNMPCLKLKRKTYLCQSCGKEFATTRNMRRHSTTCGSEDLRCRRSMAHRSSCQSGNDNVKFVRSAFNKHLITYFIENDDEVSDLDTFFTYAFETAENKILQHLQEWTSIKVNFCLDVSYENPISMDVQDRNFKTKSVTVFEESDVEQIINDGIDKIATELEEYEGKGSGYKLDIILCLVINISKYNPLKAACHMKLPKRIRMRNACDSNVYPPGNDCFRRAIVIHAVGNKTYDFDSVSFPTPLKDIVKFEKDNHVSINIYALDQQEKVYPVKVAETLRDEHFDLLLLTNQEGRHHFVRILNFERLIRPQVTKHKGAIAICRRCFTYYHDCIETKEVLLQRHLEYCTNKATRVIMPENEQCVLKFKNHQFQLRLPFIVYADIESLLVPMEEPIKHNNTVTPPTNKAFTRKYQEHRMMSYCVYVKSDIHSDNEDEDFNRALVYTGENALHHLITTLIRIGNKVMNFYNLNKPLEMTVSETIAHINANVCYLCLKPFTLDDYKVHDHDHLTSKYRGACHNSCNLNAKRPNHLPVVFHYGSNYDFKFIAQALGEVPGEIKVLANTEERFITISKRIDQDDRHLWIRFLDSYRFIPYSLNSIVKSMKPEQFKILPKLYSGKKLQLLLTKGEMPYEYMTDFTKLEETSMPPREKFYSSLTESEIKEEAYNHASEVWHTFGIKTLGEYAELYLMTDTYLLAELFENFREVFLQSEYGLDPAYYYSLPGLAFNGMQKITNVELELLSDYDMLLMVESGIRGGFTQVSERYAASDSEHQLCYIDCNNLYGNSMVDMLPQSGFTWINPKEVDLLSVSDNSGIGYIVEADISIPDHLHDYFNDMPPLPERLTPQGSKHPKLMATLSPKKNYVLHYRLLQFVIAHGCVLEKVHRVIGFHQSRWLAPFININTEKRKVATSEFEIDMWKLTNNATYGRTLMQVRKHKDMRLVNSWTKAEKLISQPNFNRYSIINEHLVAVHMDKICIKFNQPIYVGFTILELAKLKMLTFHYNIMLKHYGSDRLSVEYSDTDSYVYKIKTRNGEDWRLEVSEYLGDHFDFSNLPVQHPCYSIVNKKVLGLFKDELKGGDLFEWIVLKSKTYSMRTSLHDPTSCDPHSIKKAKGVNKNAVKKKLTFDDFKQVLLEGTTRHIGFNAIRSFHLRLYTVKVNKLSLSVNDDKRHLLPDGIKTLAHGHYRIMQVDEESDSM